MSSSNEACPSTSLPMIRKAEEAFRKNGSGLRGSRLAVQTNGLKAEIRAATGTKMRSHPATSEPTYTENQRAFMMAVDTFKRATGRNFPSLTDLLEIAESLGWVRSTREWPDQEHDAIEIETVVSAVA